MIRNNWDWLAILAIGLNLVDMLMTLPHWGKEANPLLLTIGPAGMVIAKSGAAIGLGLVWWKMEGANKHIVSKSCLGLLCCLYSIVVLSNTAVLVL